MGFAGVTDNPRPELPSRVHMNFGQDGHLVFYIPKLGRWATRGGDEVRALRELLEAVYDESVSLNTEDIL